MKKLLLAVLTASPAFLFAQTGPFTIKGTLPGLKAPAKVYLSSNVSGKGILDSAVVTNGAFQFKGNVPGPVRALLIVDRNPAPGKNVYNNPDKLDFYYEKGNFIINGTDSIKHAKFKNSKINEAYQKYNAAMAETQGAMSNEQKEIRKNDAGKAAARERYNQAYKDWKALQLTFTAQNPDSYFSLICLNYFIEEPADLIKIEPYVKGLSQNVRNTPLGISLTQEIAASRTTQIGMVAPDFTQNDVNDKPVKLSDFKGKYVLLDFWASWCKPCRMENPAVVAAYNTYKDKNFTVLSVSLDQPKGKDAWLNAIEKDGLTWTNVSDLKFWDNEVAKLYAVKSVPQNYLIGPDGKIVAINLRGEALHNKLKALLN